ncbi:hypothetical protein ATANTOWER_003934 [Ataeniobius toweri]|uniref:Uncharacterized protein n=1 Tax=Ataeniobius toweri TaxID=208326 RepID=A0ABU7A1L1_9TELE|nr:hypothetical protein [Ataeniobius toweri]
MDRIIQHLSSSCLLLWHENIPSLPASCLPPPSTLAGSSHSLRTISSHRELSQSHCGSVKPASYLSSLNLSKRIGNQWSIPVCKNFSLNLISPPLHICLHIFSLSPIIYVCSPHLVILL